MGKLGLTIKLLKTFILTKNLKKLAFWYTEESKLNKLLQENKDFYFFLKENSNENNCAKTMIGYMVYEGIVFEKNTNEALDLFIDPETNEPNDYIAQFFAGIITWNCIDMIEPVIHNFGRAWFYEGQLCKTRVGPLASPCQMKYITMCFKKASKYGSIQAQNYINKKL